MHCRDKESVKEPVPPLWWAECLFREPVFSARNKTLMKIYNCENHHLMTGAQSLFSCSWNKIFVRRLLQAFQPDSKTGQKLIQFPQKVSFCNFSVFNQHGNCTSKMHREVHNHKDGPIKRLIDYTNSFC